MNFFYQYPESLGMINAILGVKIGQYSATTIIGIIFIILVTIGLIIKKRLKLHIKQILFISLAIAWLPLFSQFMYSSVKEFQDTWFILKFPETDQHTWRACRIDKNQNLGGGLCGVRPFISRLSEYIPSNARIAFLDSVFMPYLLYYSYPSYTISDISSADYIISYYAWRDHYELNDGLLKIFTDQQKLEVQVELVAGFGTNEFIYKLK